MNNVVLTETVKTVFDYLGIELQDGIAEKLVAYTEELLKWNLRTNLTGAKNAEEFINGPLFDALTLIPVLDYSMPSFIDIGSGAGLPGIPAIIVADLKNVSLVEPRSLRASFLRHIVHFLSLKAEIIEFKDDRLEKRGFGAVSQAVFEPEEWLRRSTKLIHPHGVVYVMSSKPIEDLLLPEGAVIESQFHCVRPLKNSPRYTAKVKFDAF